MNTYSTNARVEGDRNFSFSIVPGQPIADQIRKQIAGIDAKSNEVLVLHPIPVVGSSTVAFLRGKNNTFPAIKLVGPDGIDRGDFHLHDFRHNVARPKRASFLGTDDNVAENATIIVNASGRELPSHQLDELKKLSGADDLVIATMQLGQAGTDYEWTSVGSYVLTTLVEALKKAGVGQSIASRPVITITAGLSPVNTIVITALHALCESWCAQQVAEKKDDGFHFTDLIKLWEMEDLGRTTAAANAPVLVPRELFKRLGDALAGTELGDELAKLAK